MVSKASTNVLCDHPTCWLRQRGRIVRPCRRHLDAAIIGLGRTTACHVHSTRHHADRTVSVRLRVRYRMLEQPLAITQTVPHRCFLQVTTTIRRSKSCPVLSGFQPQPPQHPRPRRTLRNLKPRKGSGSLRPYPTTRPRSAWASSDAWPTSSLLIPRTRSRLLPWWAPLATTARTTVGPPA